MSVLLRVHSQSSWKKYMQQGSQCINYAFALKLNLIPHTYVVTGTATVWPDLLFLPLIKKSRLVRYVKTRPVRNVDTMWRLDMQASFLTRATKINLILKQQNVDSKILSQLHRLVEIVFSDVSIWYLRFF